LYDFIESLRERDIRLLPEEVGKYVAQLATGLAFLHSKKILHGYLNTTFVYVPTVRYGDDDDHTLYHIYLFMLFFVIVVVF
jgi:hypothetical protein